MAINWKEVQGKYGPMYFIDSGEFLSATEQEVPSEIRRLYENYINTKKVENIQKKPRPGKDDLYQPDWLADDFNLGVTYKATYSDDFLWGVMRTAMSAKKKAAGPGGQTKLEGEAGTEVGAGGVNSSKLEAAQEITNKRLEDIQALLEEIRDNTKIVAGAYADKGIKTAKQMKDEAAADAAGAYEDDEEDEDDNPEDEV